MTTIMHVICNYTDKVNWERAFSIEWIPMPTLERILPPYNQITLVENLEGEPLKLNKDFGQIHEKRVPGL